MNQLPGPYGVDTRWYHNAHEYRYLGQRKEYEESQIILFFLNITDNDRRARIGIIGENKHRPRLILRMVA
jgi:hypothetical protein